MFNISKKPIFLIALFSICFLTGSVNANKLDLAVARFVDCSGTPGNVNCVANNVDYEKFMAEYTFALSPKLMSPAETLGYSGFYLGLEGSLTPLPSADRWRKGTALKTETPKVMFVPAIHVRKGLPWSFEIGATVNYLAESELVGLGTELKWSLFEGYRKSARGAIPDIAIRGTVTKVLGESDVDITIAGFDTSISYAFAAGGMVTFTPYVGYQYLWTIINTEALTYYNEVSGNYEDSKGDYDISGLLSNPTLTLHHLFFGVRFGYEHLAFTLEADWGIKKEWKTDTASMDIAKVANQIRLTGGIGLDF